MIIGIVGNYRKEIFFDIIDVISKATFCKKPQFLLSNDYKSISPDISFSGIKSDNFDIVINKADVVIAIGGDGTILSSIRRMGDISKPIFGIHIGGLGFLSACDSDNIIDSINLLVNKDYKIEPRLLLEVEVDKKTHIALNDIVIDKGILSRIIKLEVEIDNLLLNNYESDGIIISSPTGSTAYSLSAGGPIVSYDVEGIILTPLSSHSLSARPIIVNSKKHISVSVDNENNHFAVTIDGQVRIDCQCNQVVKIKKSSIVANIVRIEGDYYSTLRKKMGWAGNLR